MGQKIKVKVSSTDMFGNREDIGHRVMTGDGVEYVEFEKEIWISEKCYHNLNNAIPVEHFMNDDNKTKTLKPMRRFRIEKLSDFVDEKDVPKEKKEKVVA